MTKEMRELEAKIQLCYEDAERILNGSDADKNKKAAAKMDEASALQKEFDLRAEIEQKGKKAAAVTAAKAETKINGFDIMAKLLRGRHLTEDELAQITMDEKAHEQLISGTNAANGENYLCPEDVNLAIHELRKSYVQARDYITVERTSALTGSITFGSDPNAGLVAFNDGDTLDDQNAPTFIPKSYSIAWYGAFIPVSQILEDAERANLLNYLRRWFVKRAVITENTKIFTVLKAGYNSGTPKAIAGIEALKTVINKDLDPSCLIDGVIITNQDGYDCLDHEVDGNGDAVLQPDVTKPSVKRFKDLPVVVFPTALLPNISSGHFPVIVGDLKAGAIMKLYKSLLFATSAHAGFFKAQNVIRVMEGFDVVAADTSAYVYGSMTASA